MGLHAHHEDALHARSTSIQRQRTLVNPSCVWVLGFWKNTSIQEDAMKRSTWFFMDLDDGGAGGGATEEKDPRDAEIEGLRKQLDEQRQKAEDAEKRLKDSEDAKLSEDERRAAAEMDEKARTVSKIKELQAKALGIDSKYAGLIQGETAEEIEGSATLLSQMLRENAERVENDIKKQVSRTGASGASVEREEAMDSSEFYMDLLRKQKQKG